MRRSWRDRWGALALRASALGLWLVACSADPGTGTGTTPTAEVVSTPVVTEAAPLPDSVPDLLKLVPKSATMVVSLPSLRTIKSALDPALVKLLEDSAADLAPRIGITSDLTRQTLQSFNGAVVFLDGKVAGQAAAALVRLDDNSVIEPLVQAAKLKQAGPDRWSNDTMHVALLAKAKLVVIATKAETLDATLAMARGGGPSFADGPLFRPRPEQAIWVSGDLGAIDDDGEFGPGSAMLAAIDLVGGSLDVETIQNGPAVPRMGSVIVPSPHTSLARLPSGALAAFGLSLKRAPGVDARKLVTEIFRGKDMQDGIDRVDATLRQLAKIRLADLDHAIGDDAAGAVYYEGPRVELKNVEAAFKKGGAFVGTLAIRDQNVVRALVDLLAAEAKVKVVNGKLRKEKDGLVLELETTASELRVVFGAPKMVAKLKTAKQTLNDDPVFTAARKTAATETSGIVYGNIPEMVKVLPDEARGYFSAGVGPLLLHVLSKPSDKGGHYVMAASGGKAVVATLGTIVAVAIAGTRDYLRSAKTSEAKNSLGAIGRGAIAAYERETGPGAAHALCKSGQPVPASVPSGKKYQPSSSPGADYETGSQQSGWKCLKFAMTNPQYYQYDYRAGGNYKGPKRGLPDPGPNGFEASAEGDLDGDGKTSLFTLTGKVVNGSIKLAPEINVADEFE